MADKQERGILRGAIPSEGIVSLASERLKSVCKESRQEEILKVLSKRRRKWRKKHKLPFQAYQALDPQLREEKEVLNDSLVELKEVLVKKRRDGLTLAMQFQKERGDHCLETIQQRLQEFAESFKPCREASFKSSIQPPPSRVWLSLEEQMAKEIQSAISQCATLAEMRQMKHHMTPRIPPLHDRTLSGNIFDASFGLFHDEDGEDIQIATTTGLIRESETTSMHGLTSKIAPEFATIHSDEMNGYNHYNIEDMEIVLEDQLPVIAETVEHTSDEQYDEEKLIEQANTQFNSKPLETDTGGYAEEQHSTIDSNITIYPTDHYDITSEQTVFTTTSTLAAPNMFKTQGVQTVNEEEIDDGELSYQDEGERDIVSNSTDTDSDSQSYSKLLKNIERAPYEFRVRVRNSERLKKLTRTYYSAYNNK